MSGEMIENIGSGLAASGPGLEVMQPSELPAKAFAGGDQGYGTLELLDWIVKDGLRTIAGRTAGKAFEVLTAVGGATLNKALDFKESVAQGTKNLVASITPSRIEGANEAGKGLERGQNTGAPSTQNQAMTPNQALLAAHSVSMSEPLVPSYTPTSAEVFKSRSMGLSC